jgi:hypothetical protein
VTGRFRDATDLRRTLETRLKQDGDESGTARRRRLVVFDRMAVRLVEDPAGSWFLRGGAAMDLRLTGRARTTKDLDLAVRPEDGSDTDGDGVWELLIEALPVDLDGDWFRFRAGAPVSLTVDTRDYGDRLDTWVKDPVDLVLLTEDGLPGDAALVSAVRHVFAVRDAHNIPDELPDCATPTRSWPRSCPRTCRRRSTRHSRCVWAVGGGLADEIPTSSRPEQRDRLS